MTLKTRKSSVETWKICWQPLFWFHKLFDLLFCILPVAKYMSGFYPVINFIHLFPPSVKTSFASVSFYPSLSSSCILPPRVTDSVNTCSIGFAFNQKGSTHSAHRAKWERRQQVVLSVCRYRSRMTHPDVTWRAYDAPGEQWTGPKVLGLWSFSPKLSHSNPHSWIQAKQGSATLARRRLKSRRDCFHLSMIILWMQHWVSDIRL